MTVNIEQLSAYYDGEIAPEERRAVESHRPGCSDCRSALQRWGEVAATLSATEAPRAPSRKLPALVPAGIAALLLVGAGVAVAGPFNEIFRSGNVSAVGSRPVTLEEARVAKLPLPRSVDLPGGWRVNQVQLSVTPTWRSVDVQYRRPGSRGMGITAWSQDINVVPGAERREIVTVSGIPVELGYAGESVSARFTHGASTVIVRAFTDEVDVEALRTLVAAWIERAR
jgi:anti-sigma factor RsiW